LKAYVLNSSPISLSGKMPLFYFNQFGGKTTEQLKYKAAEPKPMHKCAPHTAINCRTFRTPGKSPFSLDRTTALCTNRSYLTSQDRRTKCVHLLLSPSLSGISSLFLKFQAKSRRQGNAKHSIYNSPQPKFVFVSPPLFMEPQD
jgi:hypothetical protein